MKVTDKHSDLMRNTSPPHLPTTASASTKITADTIPPLLFSRENGTSRILHGPRNVTALIKYTVRTQRREEKNKTKKKPHILFYCSLQREGSALETRSLKRETSSWVWMHKNPHGGKRLSNASAFSFFFLKHPSLPSFLSTSDCLSLNLSSLVMGGASANKHSHVIGALDRSAYATCTARSALMARALVLPHLLLLFFFSRFVGHAGARSHDQDAYGYFKRSEQWKPSVSHSFRLYNFNINTYNKLKKYKWIYQSQLNEKILNCTS